MIGNNLDFGYQTPDLAERRRKKIVIPAIIFGVILLVAIIIIALAVTVFEIEPPEIELTSMKVKGMDPSAQLSQLQMHLNLTFSLNFLVRNPNKASFKYAGAETQVTYRSSQIGDAILPPGYIAAESSTAISCQLGLSSSPLSAMDALQLAKDVIAGEISVDTHTKVPGKVYFLGGLIDKKVVAVAECRIGIALADMKTTPPQCSGQAVF